MSRLRLYGRNFACHSLLFIVNISVFDSQGLESKHTLFIRLYNWNIDNFLDRPGPSDLVLLSSLVRNEVLLEVLRVAGFLLLSSKFSLDAVLNCRDGGVGVSR